MIGMAIGLRGGTRLEGGTNMALLPSASKWTRPWQTSGYRGYLADSNFQGVGMGPTAGGRLSLTEQRAREKQARDVAGGRTLSERQFEEGQDQSRLQYELQLRKQGYTEDQAKAAAAQWAQQFERSGSQWESEFKEGQKRWGYETGEDKRRWGYETGEDKRRWGLEAEEKRRLADEGQGRWTSQFEEGVKRAQRQYELQLRKQGFTESEAERMAAQWAKEFTEQQELADEAQARWEKEFAQRVLEAQRRYELALRQQDFEEAQAAKEELAALNAAAAAAQAQQGGP